MGKGFNKLKINQLKFGKDQKAMRSLFLLVSTACLLVIAFSNCGQVTFSNGVLTQASHGSTGSNPNPAASGTSSISPISAPSSGSTGAGGNGGVGTSSSIVGGGITPPTPTNLNLSGSSANSGSNQLCSQGPCAIFPPAGFVWVSESIISQANNVCLSCFTCSPGLTLSNGTCN